MNIFRENDKFSKLNDSLRETIENELLEIEEGMENLCEAHREVSDHYRRVTARRRVLNQIKCVLEGDLTLHQTPKNGASKRLLITATVLSRPFTSKDLKTIHPEIKNIPSLLQGLIRNRHISQVGRVKIPGTARYLNLYSV